ncbi:aminoglycoside phosphotransferase family protein [Paenibacillus dokdonensis]|uniref:Aminoglycoside phosphotransferase family protein n=1 Tax=Paenibacillus dokdonensis TaxID=2567944 RepID=A0ABU6GLS0_9BACL|nr:aminoglycoside phosphotransferase family protein [Paenibacillus dokdonensis]MEC0240373.1 aminoglycoside phosphotransferase family protein [Paenibacillus dokdonensis]
MDEKIQELLNIIRQRVDFDRAELLNKGYSSVRKYMLYQSDQPLYLLRVYELDSHARRLEEYQYLQQHYDNGVNCQEPVFFGVIHDLKLCCLLLSYTEGESGEEVLPYLTPQSQFKQGIAAGEELKKIHTIIPVVPINWVERRYDKYIQKKTKVKELGIQFHKQAFIEHYIESNFDLLSNSSVCFQHDDFHPSNMIFKNEKFVGVIDFSSFDWGDPWEEFFKLPKYTCFISKRFAYGQVQGYFNGSIPKDFWLKYNLFVALNQHATLIGGFQNHRTKEVLDKIEQIIETHDFSHGGPPAWYQEDKTVMG